MAGRHRQRDPRLVSLIPCVCQRHSSQRTPRDHRRSRGEGGGMKIPTVRIMVACNNRNGLIERRFEAIRFHTPADVIAEVECPPTAITENWASGRLASVKLGRFLFTPVGHAQHVGNLAWNEYVVHQSDRYFRFVCSLDRRGARCECITVPKHMSPILEDWAHLVLARGSNAA